jgi:hypothetical protein
MAQRRVDFEKWRERVEKLPVTLAQFCFLRKENVLRYEVRTSRQA